MTEDKELKLYQTQSHECSYLEEHRAQTLFVDPEARLDTHSMTYLAELGFRRSGDFVYRPSCAACQACIPARIPVQDFQPNRTQRRIWRRNQGLSCEITKPRFSDELYDLYRRYIETRHRDGDMYPSSPDQFCSFLVDSRADSCFIEHRDNGKLVAVAVTDRLDNAYSAVYTFFDPDNVKASYGVYTLLSQIELARHNGLDYLYLGYWIKACQKMSYKIQYRPVELFINKHWTVLS